MEGRGGEREEEGREGGRVATKENGSRVEYSKPKNNAIRYS